jgi:hypothetical protein
MGGRAGVQPLLLPAAPAHPRCSSHLLLLLLLATPRGAPHRRRCTRLARRRQCRPPSEGHDASGAAAAGRMPPSPPENDGRCAGHQCRCLGRAAGAPRGRRRQGQREGSTVDSRNSCAQQPTANSQQQATVPNRHEATGNRNYRCLKASVLLSVNETVACLISATRNHARSRPSMGPVSPFRSLESYAASLQPASGLPSGLPAYCCLLILTHQSLGNSLVTRSRRSRWGRRQ